AIDGTGKQIIGHELVVAFCVQIRDVEIKQTVLQLSTGANDLHELQVVSIQLRKRLPDMGQGGNLLERFRNLLWKEADYKVLGARAFDDQCQLRGGVAQLDCRLRVGILGAVDHVGPVHQLLQVISLEAEFRGPDVGKEFGARTEFGPVEFPAAGVAAEVLGVGFAQEGALVMVKPPGQAVGTRILKVDDRVFITIEEVRLEELAGPVHQAAVVEHRLGVNARPVETSKEGSRASA